MTNFLSPIDFGFTIGSAPELQYTVQSVQIPGLNLGTASVPTPFVRMPMPGNISYDELSVTFKIDENMENYLRIFKWMEKLGTPDKFEDYEHNRCDCTLLFMNSSKRPTIEVRFTEAYPTALSPILMDTTSTDLSYVTATATFSFLRFHYSLVKDD